MPDSDQVIGVTAIEMSLIFIANSLSNIFNCSVFLETCFFPFMLLHFSVFI